MAPDWRLQRFSDHLRISSPSTEIRPKQQVAQEGTYAVKTTTLRIALNDSVTVNALLREPISAPGKRPACLLLQGAGTGTAESVYGDVAGGMASAGIVTLVPDKRLDDYSMMRRDYATMAHDYGVSLNVLRNLPDVAASHTGIYAESEGTWVTTMMTYEHPDLAFAILTSPPVFSGRQQMTMAASSYLNTIGAPKALVDDAPKLTSMDFSMLGLNYADFPAEWYLASLRMPVLVNYGIDDQSMPIEQGAQQIIGTAARVGNKNVTVRFYPTNHQMRVGSRLSKPGLPLDPNYTKNLENWVNGVALGTSVDGWQTPMVAGAQPDQRFSAPQGRISPGLIGSLQELLGLVIGLLAATLMAVTTALVLAMKSLVVGFAARRSTTQDDDVTSRASATRPPRARFASGVGRVLGAGLSVTIISILGFVAYLVVLLRAALQLQERSALFNYGWWALRAATLVLVVLLAWLIEKVFGSHARSRTHQMHRVTATEPVPRTGLAFGANRETLLARGFGHRFMVVAVVAAMVLWLILLAFWGIFSL